MARPRHEQPTPGEIEVLKVLWDRGPCTVRQVMEELNKNRRRAYTSVMSLLNVMADKGLVKRQPHGRAFLYRASTAREETLGRIVGDLLSRVFEGSASALVSHVLDQSRLSPEEMEELRKLIRRYQR